MLSAIEKTATSSRKDSKKRFWQVIEGAGHLLNQHPQLKRKVFEKLEMLHHGVDRGKAEGELVEREGELISAVDPLPSSAPIDP